ncbi:MAG: response regulator [SAR324 cluster bacterium]|nr:response regulator [SAR324 cluster bacterium]
MRVLLVEDDNNLLEELENLLTRRNHIVTTAKNGQQAWEEYSNFPNIFDIILTDVKMPVMDGMQLLKKIRQYDSEALVIIMTAQGDLEMSVEALKLGALSFLNKPLNPRELLSALGKLEIVRPPRHSQINGMNRFNKQIQFSLSSCTESLSSATFYLERSFKWLWQLSDMNSPQMQACLYEAILNGIVHGNLEIPSSYQRYSREFDEIVAERELRPEFANRQITIRAEFNEKQFQCEIQDEGKGFEFSQLPDIGDTASLLVEGKGLQIIRYYMDQVSWNESGNTIKMVKNTNLSGSATT